LCCKVEADLVYWQKMHLPPLRVAGGKRYEVTKKLQIFILVLLMIGLTACASSSGHPETTVPETTVETTPAVQTAPTEAATEATLPPTEATLPPTEPSPVLHSGLREDGSFDEGTLFIGDSMTCLLVDSYLAPRGLLGDAWSVARYGARVVSFFDESVVMLPNSGKRCIFRPEHLGMGYAQVAGDLGEKLTAIYMMFGSNRTENAGAQAYIDIVDYLLQTCPNATIHLQLIPWGVEDIVLCDEANAWIREAYEHYQQEAEPRVMLIDTHTAIGINTFDGVHLDDTGNENWYNAIVEHAKANGLVQ